jgi:hypothetical protein
VDRPVPAVVLSLLVLSSIVPSAAVAADPAAAVPATEQTAIDEADALESTADATDARGPASRAASPTIRVDTALSLTPDSPGSIGVVQTFALPDELTELSVTLGSRSTVTASNGFTRSDEGTWTWDGETTSPTLTYRLAANRTGEATGPLGTDGSYLYADVGPWALVQTPKIGMGWRYRGSEPVVSRTTRVEGDGAVGGDTAFLGAHEVYSRQVNGQTIQLVVPEAAEMAEAPERVLTALANASGELQVGDRDPTVFAVAAPTGQIDWAVQGLQVGSHDFWVRDSQRVETVGNAWLHEYVHTRQSFETADSARWFIEASATWYAALLSLDEGATFAEFRQFLARGARSPQTDAVLAEPATWRANAQYWKGALVLGDLDRRMRLVSNQSASLQYVFRSLNGRTTPVTNPDIIAAVGTDSSSTTQEAAKRFTTTSETPEMWEESAQRQAFGSRPAQMSLAFDAGEDISYAGPYRSGPAQTPITVAAGERLSVRTTVRNVGDATGEYDVVLRVADVVVSRANGTLEPSESTTARLDYRFTAAGTYTVSIAGERLAVRVREPANPSVTGLAVDRSAVERGGTVTATATVENTAKVPGNRTVVFTRNGEPVAERTVTLGPGERTTVSAPVTMPPTGDHRIGAGEQSVSVQVTAGTETVPVPGFGVPAALTAGALLAGLLRLCSRA